MAWVKAGVMVPPMQMRPLPLPPAAPPRSSVVVAVAEPAAAVLQAALLERLVYVQVTGSVFAGVAVELSVEGDVIAVPTVVAPVPRIRNEAAAALFSRTVFGPWFRYAVPNEMFVGVIEMLAPTAAVAVSEELNDPCAPATEAVPRIATASAVNLTRFFITWSFEKECVD